MRGTVRPEAAIPEKALPAFANWLQNEFGLQFFIGEAQISVCRSYHSDGDPLALIAQNRKLRTQLI